MRERQRTGYTRVPFPALRVPIVDSLRAARRKPLMSALIEVDITRPLLALRARERRTGERLSLTAFIIYCVARAVAEYPMTQAVWQGRKRLLLFDDVDVCAPIEHATGVEKLATPYVIRRANRKPLRAIHEEIRAAQRAGVGSAWEMRVRRLYPHLPTFARLALWRAFNHFPRLRQRIAGAVMVTAVGMFGSGAAWGFSPISEYTLQVIVGGIVERLALAEGRVEVHEYLCLTLSADHEILDGAPFARFVRRLSELLSAGAGLEEAGVSLATCAPRALALQNAPE